MTQALREAIAARRDLVVEEMAALEREARLCDHFLTQIDAIVINGMGGDGQLPFEIREVAAAKPKRKWTPGKHGPKAVS